MKRIMIFMLITLTGTGILASPDKQTTVASPDGKLRVNLVFTGKIYYNLEVDGIRVIQYSPLSMVTAEAGTLGLDPVLEGVTITPVDEILQNTFGIRTRVRNTYNELVLVFKGGYHLIFRAYNDGVAYRWKTQLKGPLTVLGEEVEYRFAENYTAIAHVTGDFQTSYEKTYSRLRIGDMQEEAFSSLPMVVDQGGLKLLITESDLHDYPGMYLMRPGSNSRYHLRALFPGFPATWEQAGWGQFNLRVTRREACLAKTRGDRVFPWRVIGVAREDKELADNELVWKLARPAAIEASWVKPGKVSWDWWNAWNLEGVDFQTGINNQTYEYYIDFAARNKLEYIIMDEGWSDPFDLMLLSPRLDMDHLTRYARERGVGIILWAVWHTLDRQMDEAFRLFEKWGIAGVKVDFIDRDDQVAVQFYEKLAAEAARHRMLVDFHGCSKPAGLNRTWPNVINFEAVRGNEYNKFGINETPGHNVDLVFTRMTAGPMDYTPGAMRNSIEGEFLTSNDNPMSYGTRCHQLAMYVVYFAPLQMLCDAPTAYDKYPDILSFLSRVPVTWDETVVFDGKLGEYVVMARKKGEDWYLGGMTDWNERVVEVDLSRLTPGSYQAEMFLDGVNANKLASDYRIIRETVDSSRKLQLTMKKGGGFAIHLKKL